MHPDKPSDPALIRLQLASGEASLSDEGAGPAVVCVHGLPGSARDFRWLAPALTERGLRCVRVELPGFGQSSADVAPHIEDVADHVAEIMSALRLCRPMVLGHSFGGTVALATAARYPDRVGRLALVASMGFRRHQAFERFAWGVEMARWAHTPVVKEPVRALLQVAFRKFGFRHDVNRETVVRAMTLIRDVDFGQQVVRGVRLKVPTAVIWCKDDPLIQDEISQDLARRVPEGPRLCFESGGHNPQKTFATEIAEALASWLSTEARSS